MDNSAYEAKDLRGLHDVNESARLLGKSHWWLRKLAKRGCVAFIRQGRQRRLMFEGKELLRLMEEERRKYQKPRRSDTGGLEPLTRRVNSMRSN